MANESMELVKIFTGKERRCSKQRW